MKIDLVYIFLIILSFIVKKLIGGPIFEVAFYVMIAMFILGLLYIIYFYRYINFKVTLENEKLRVFDSGLFKFKIINDGLLFAPFIEIKDKEKTFDLFGIKRKKEVYYNVNIKFDVRGTYKNKEFKITIKDPFNIFTITKTKILPEINVYPIFYENLGLFTISKNKFKLGLLKSYDVDNIRKYNLGDDLRKVNWNIFAKTGDMYVTENAGDNFITTAIIIDMNKANNKDINEIKNKKRSMEEYLIGFSLSLSNYLIKNDLKHKIEINNKIFKTLEIKKERDILIEENYLAQTSSNGDLLLNKYLKTKAINLNKYSSIIIVTMDIKSLNLHDISRTYKNSEIDIFVFKLNKKTEKPSNVTIYDIGEIINES